MSSQYTDLASLAGSPHRGSETTTKSNGKKRGVASGRLRLMPLDSSSSSAAAYDVSGPTTSNNNNNHNNNNASGNGTGNMIPTSTGYGFGGLKKITHKKELVEAVRKANSPIVLPTREPLGASIGGHGSVMGPSSIRHESSSSSLPDDDTSASRDIESLADGVHLNARKYNERKMMADKRHRELNTLLDELRTLQLETQTLSRLQNQETPIAKQSQRIRDEIEKCTASMEEQMHQRRQLEHMTRRLQTGQLKIDSHLQAMAKAVDASENESTEVKSLCRQLEAGKSRAVQFLQDIQVQIQMDRRTRARELNDTEVRARNAQRMEAWRLQRIQERTEMAAELRGDLSVEEEQRLMRSIENRERANKALHVANQTKSQKTADYEEVLDQLKLAMAATSLAEVVGKVQAQAMTIVSLDREKTQAEVRMARARHDKDLAVQGLNELKASGIGGIDLNREVYNTLENEILQAKATLKVNKAAYERLDGVIQAVQQGSFGLAQRLQVFDDALDLTPGDATSANENPSSNVSGAYIANTDGSTTSGSTSSIPAASGRSNIPSTQLPSCLDKIDCLALAELKLTKMLELIGQQSSSGNNFGGVFGNTSSTANGGDSAGDNFGDGQDDADNGSRTEFLDDRNALWSPTTNNDPVLHRNNIRVQPLGRVSSAGNAGGVTGRFTDLEAGDLALDSARSDTSTVSDSEHMDVLVPSRDILKMSSSRHFAEVLRKQEMAEKQKAAAERGISDEEMLSKLRKKNQQDADARLSTSPTRQSQLMLPGSSAKDDTLNNSVAFVTQLNFNEL